MMQISRTYRSSFNIGDIVKYDNIQKHLTGKIMDIDFTEGENYFRGFKYLIEKSNKERIWIEELNIRYLNYDLDNNNKQKSSDYIKETIEKYPPDLVNNDTFGRSLEEVLMKLKQKGL